MPKKRKTNPIGLSPLPPLRPNLPAEDLLREFASRIEHRFYVAALAENRACTGAAPPTSPQSVIALLTLQSLSDLRVVLQAMEREKGTIWSRTVELATDLHRRQEGPRKGGEKGTWSQWPWEGKRDQFDQAVCEKAKEIMGADPGIGRQELERLVAEAIEFDHRTTPEPAIKPPRVTKDAVRRSLQRCGFHMKDARKRA